MIKRHAIRIDISRQFFQLSQNLIIRDQQLTAKNPTVRWRHRWRINAPEVSGVRVSGGLPTLAPDPFSLNFCYPWLKPKPLTFCALLGLNRQQAGCELRSFSLLGHSL
jgi:hypothetical protein